MRIILSSAIFFLLFVFLIQAPFAELNRNRSSALLYEALEEQRAKELEEKRHIFEELALEAKAVLVRDYSSGTILFERNADNAFPLASLAKLMTAVTLQDIYAYADSPFPFSVRLPESAIRQEGDSNLLIDEKFYLDDLTDIMLVNSSNDAAYALAVFAGTLFLGGETEERGALNSFIAAMNRKKEELGFSSMNFFNSTGLDINAERAGAYGNAKDISSLAALFLEKYPFLLEKTQYESFIAVSNVKAHSFKNTNVSAFRIPGLLLSKTGFSDLAGGNLVIAVDVGLARIIIITVLGSTFDGRFSDVEKLYDAAVQYYSE